MPVEGLATSGPSLARVEVEAWVTGFAVEPFRRSSQAVAARWKKPGGMDLLAWAELALVFQPLLRVL